MNDTPIERLKELDARETAEERLQSELVRAILEALPDAIVVVDIKGEIRLVNHQTELVFGYHRSELYGQLVEILLPDSLKGQHPSHRNDFWDDPRPRAMGAGRVLSAKKRDGKEFPVEIMLSPLVTKQGRFVITLIRRMKP